jgi:hypothetical protein
VLVAQLPLPLLAVTVPGVASLPAAIFAKMPVRPLLVVLKAVSATTAVHPAGADPHAAAALCWYDATNMTRRFPAVVAVPHAGAVLLAAEVVMVVMLCCTQATVISGPSRPVAR